MSTITLPNIRVGSDLQIRVRLTDGGVAIDWSTLSNVKAYVYSDAQRAMAGRCTVSVDGDDPTLLVCDYSATKPQYLGANRIVVSAKYMGETKTYDKPAFTFVRWTDDQSGEQITIDDPDVDVEIEVQDVTSSILDEAVQAALSAAERANEAAEAAEHMVDIHTGPKGDKGDTGETPDISIGTVTTVEPGTPAAASMGGTPEAPVLNLSIPKGAVGATPNFTVGTVTTGQPGTPVVITITGTAEAPVLNVTIPQGLKGDTGVSADYPITIHNGLDSDATDEALAAAQGKILDGKVSQLEAEVHNLSGKYYGAYTSATDLPEGDALGYAFVGESDPLALYEFRDGEWNETGIEISGIVGPPGVQGLPGATGEQGPAGVTSVVASVDSGTGVPSVDVTLVGQTLNLVFHNLKGIQGNTGSSVSYAFELVNNLTTDDATKGLSAAQGKYLYDLLEGTPVTHFLDLPSYTEVGNCIGSTQSWFSNGAASPRNSIVIPLDGIGNLKVATSGNGYIAFLKSLSNMDAGGACDFATGYPDRIRVDTTTVEYATLPSDAHYLYVQTRFVDGADVRDRYVITYTTPSNGVIFRNEIVDNLASEETIYPLSAKQGKVLKGLVDGNTDNIGRLLAQNGGSFAGKKVSIIGDSISTILNGNTPYWKVLSVDVGQTIQSYVTWEDIYGNYRYPDRTHPTGKTIGGVTLTEAMVDGELHSFTPVLADVGKEIGVPHHYSNNDGTFQVWSQRLCSALGMTLLANASWSGSAITSMEVEGRGIDFTASHAWHPCTIGRCRGRNATTGAFINPDIIIVYRGTNDFTYGNNGEYPTLQISDVSLLDGFSATTDKVGESTYNFRIGYYLTIKALREAYPNAIIYIATLNVFKRVHYDMWPTRNDAFTLPELNKVIREIADVTGCGIIELDKDGITFENCYPTYINDSQYTPTHPNGNGHRVMAEKAVTDLVYSLNPTA